MTGGQVLDMESTGKIISEKELNMLHACKTGALIRASVVSGAKLCGAGRDELTALEAYGSKIGLAFQIQDDVLDIEGDEKLLGKDIGSDEGNLKSTYPAIIGLENSKVRAAKLVDEAVSRLSMFGSSADPLREIAKYIIERNM
jgi:geranylgeranyl diphosphate synthase type II